MTTQETALKYGVPMPDICQALNLKGETLFYWNKNEKHRFLYNGIFYNEDVRFGKEKGMWIIARTDNHSCSYYKTKEEILKDFIPAPTAQELFEVLPNAIHQGVFELTINKQLELVYYDKEFMYVEIQNNNLAELYILLRENNLL